MCVVSQSDLASREGAGDPQQVQSLEGHQNEADVGSQVLGTFWVHEMVGGVAAHVRFKAHSGCQVYSAKRPDIFTGTKIPFLSHITFPSYKAVEQMIK